MTGKTETLLRVALLSVVCCNCGCVKIALVIIIFRVWQWHAVRSERVLRPPCTGQRADHTLAPAFVRSGNEPDSSPAFPPFHLPSPRARPCPAAAYACATRRETRAVVFSTTPSRQARPPAAAAAASAAAAAATAARWKPRARRRSCRWANDQDTDEVY